MTRSVRNESRRGFGRRLVRRRYYGRLRAAAGAPATPVNPIYKLSVDEPEPAAAAPPSSPAKAAVDALYADVREAALSSLDFEELRRQRKMPTPNPRPHAQRLVLGARLDDIERELERRLAAKERQLAGGAA